MSVNRAAVDTNILVYAHLTDSPYYAASAAFLDRAKDPSADLYLFPQMLSEFFAIITNPKRVTIPMTASTAILAIDKFLANPGLTVLPVPPDIVSRLLALLRSNPITGRQVFDYQLAAAMISSGISTLFTYNVKDFSSIPGITAVEPPIPAPAATSPTT